MTMIHKIQHFFEAVAVLLTIHWQPVFGVLAGMAATLYHISMLKINVVNKGYEGSWKKYILSIFKRKRKK